MGDLGAASGGKPHHPALAQNTDGVEDDEGAVAQPSEAGGVNAGQQQSKVRVADDLGCGPGGKHARVAWAGGDRREEPDDTPDKEVARANLHSGGDEGRSYEACMARMGTKKTRSVEMQTKCISASHAEIWTEPATSYY